MRCLPCLVFPVFLLLLANGCTTSTIESRRELYKEDYAALSPEHQALVDQGQVRVGMSEEAVRIAWGDPHQVLRGEDELGPNETWQYHSVTLEPRNAWAYSTFWPMDGPPILTRQWVTNWEPQYHETAEVIFRKKKVSEWHTLTR